MAGNKVPVSVNEVEIAKKVGEGTRNPSQAGIRIGGEKCMFVRYDDELMAT